MNKSPTIPALAWAALAFSAWRSFPLLHAWQHSPLDRFGWLAFAIWLVPVPVAWATRTATDPGSACRLGFLLPASILAALVGALGQLNAAAYAGLALAVAAITPARSILRLAAWLVTAAAWMPVFSWIGHGLPSRTLILLRVGLAFAGAGAMVLHRRVGPACSRP